jgi:hypothetical protein
LTWGFAALHPRLYAVARCRGLGLVGPLPELEEKLHGELHVAAFKIAASEDATLRRYKARSRALKSTCRIWILEETQIAVIGFG